MDVRKPPEGDLAQGRPTGRLRTVRGSKERCLGTRFQSVALESFYANDRWKLDCCRSFLATHRHWTTRSRNWRKMEGVIHRQRKKTERALKKLIPKGAFFWRWALPCLMSYRRGTPQSHHTKRCGVICLLPEARDASILGDLDA